MARLVTAAHGTRGGEGNAVAVELTRLAGHVLGVEAVISYVELQSPLVSDVLASSTDAAVVVPLLLSRGYHTRVDLPDAAEHARGPVNVTLPLGPSHALARTQVVRLVEAGATPGQPVVLLAAGSNDLVAADDLAEAAILLGEAWGSPCRVATMAEANVAAVVRPGDAASLYVLAPGHFARELAAAARAAGAAVVSEVLGPHPTVVELVCDRFRSAR